MPIYEYECPKCGEKFERRRGMTESDDGVKCPACGTARPQRVFSAFATQGSVCAPSSST